MDTSARTKLATVGRVAADAVIALGGAVHGLLWWLVAQISCDDWCSTNESWRYSPHSWQWSAMGTSGFASFLLSIGFAIAFGRPGAGRLSSVLLIAAAGTAIAPWVINATA